jgi:Uma2 family endonuclease
MSLVTARADEGYTVEDLDVMPDDGFRRELVDGVLLVSPPPAVRHQIALHSLNAVVTSAAPGGIRVLFAPLGVRLSLKTSFEPDLVVAPDADFAEMFLPVPPLLAVEVLSPSTEHVDRGLKRSAYEAYGIQHYWIVDPLAPSVTAWELVDGTYVEAGHAEGDAALVVERPFPVRIVPAELIT